jgi:hypothetical protein
MTTTPPRVTFRVPNDEDGNTFIKLARKYVNRERYGSILTRPRGGTRGKYQYSCQRFDATGFGVYLEPRKEVEAAENEARERYSISTYKHNLEVDELRIAHTEKCVELRCRIADLQKLREQNGTARDSLRVQNAELQKLREYDRQERKSLIETRDGATAHVAELQRLRNESWEQCSKLKAERDEANLKLAKCRRALIAVSVASIVAVVALGVTL